MANVRNLAVNAVIAILEDNAKSHIVTNRILGEEDFSKEDKDFFLRLVDGTVERKITIDYVINKISKTPVNKQKKPVRNILRCAIYQILFMDKIPDSAAVNEAVKICNKRGLSGLKGFVNGVLRQVVRSKEDILLEIENSPLDIKYSCPKFIVDAFGDDAETILSATLDKNKINARLNLVSHTREEILEMMKASNMVVEDNPYVKGAVYISKFGNLKEVPAYAMGLFTIMDTASMMPGIASGVKEESLVVDVSAAPGGKSLHVAGLMNGTGKVIARDVSEQKVSLINENVKRLKAGNVTTKVWDGRKVDKSLVGKADLLICDLPCSGLGVIGRKADIKYRVSSEDIKSLVSLQKEILEGSVPLLKEGGVMIYSTCTITPEENVQMVSYIKEHFGLKTESMFPYLKEYVTNEFAIPETAKDGYMQIVPGKYDMDGFFVARFVK